MRRGREYMCDDKVKTDVEEHANISLLLKRERRIGRPNDASHRITSNTHRLTHAYIYNTDIDTHTHTHKKKFRQTAHMQKFTHFTTNQKTGTYNYYIILL